MVKENIVMGTMFIIMLVIAAVLVFVKYDNRPGMEACAFEDGKYTLTSEGFVCRF